MQKQKKTLFDPNEILVEGSLGILALGDVGFEAWRKVKIENKKNRIDEEKK